MRCPRWLGLHARSLGQPPDLKQVPLSRGRPLVRMPLLTCLDRKLTPCWLVHPPLSTCQGMRIAVRMKCTQTLSHHIPQLVVQLHQQWKTIVMYSLLILVQQKVNLPQICPYYEGFPQPDQTTDSVFIQQPNDPDFSNSQNSIPSSPVPSAPRRSTRSTKGTPPVHFGKVNTHSTIISEVAKPTKYKQTLYVPC